MASDKKKPRWPSKEALAVVLAVTFMVVSVAAPAVLAATSNDPVTDHLKLNGLEGEETAPNPYINGTRTTSAYDMSQGTSDEALAGYEDDAGDWVAGSDTPFVVNTSMDVEDGTNVNHYTFSPGHIEDSSYTAFPDKEDRSWTNSSRWTKGGANSSGLTVSNSTAAQGVDAVRFNTGTSFASGDTAHANFSAWDGELDSDESKRVLQVAMDVDNLESSTNVSVRLYDESDDYKEITLNQSETALSGNNFAASTGDSKVFQIKLSKLSTTGGGTWDNIEKVSVQIDDGDADLVMSWLDVRKKSKNVLGEKRATTDDDGNDPDSDSDWDEFQTIYNATGDISIHSMDTLSTEYDDAVIHDITFPFHYRADGLDENGEDGTYVIYWDDPQNPGFAATLNVTYELQLPSAVDLSYSNTDVLMTQKWSESRYLAFDYDEAVAESLNLSEQSGTSQLSTLAARGDDLTIDSTSVDAGDRMVIHYEIEVDEEEQNSLEVAPDGGAAGPTTGGGGFIDGLVNFVTNPLGAVISLVTVVLSFRWWRSR